MSQVDLNLSVQRHFEAIADIHCQSSARANTQTPVSGRNSIKDANFGKFCHPHSGLR